MHLLVVRMSTYRIQPTSKYQTDHPGPLLTSSSRFEAANRDVLTAMIDQMRTNNQPKLVYQVTSDVVSLVNTSFSKSRLLAPTAADCNDEARVDRPRPQ